ncbi:hypothetical protein J4406_02535 [Candidatus Woesearchaeota archaeon]|nr:hypothetical protein [Candidatus Woesearchaeota archaeon]
MGDIKYFEEGGKFYKIDSDGEKYRISFSEELQMKNIKMARENKKWLKYNFYAKVMLSILILILVIMIGFTLFRLDKIDFFTGILYRNAL